MWRIVLRACSLGGLLALVLASVASAQPAGLPRSPAAEALAEPMPFTFHVADFTTEDFTVDRTEGDAGPVVKIESGSLQWVRGTRLLALPRAVLTVSAEGVDRGVVSYAGFNHSLHLKGAVASAELPVVLLSGAGLPIRVQTQTRGVQHVSVFAIRFAPRANQRGRVIFDSSCSPFGLGVRGGALPDDSFLEVSCRLVQTAHEDRSTPTLELYLLWDNAGPGVVVDGAQVAPTLESMWTYRVNTAPGEIKLAARGAELTLEYHVPERLHDGFVGLGLGPYYYTLKDNAVDVEGQISLLTVYAGYTLNPAARIVYFNATTLDRQGYSDNGLYFWFEQARMFDQRFSLNLLLGANVLIYRRDDAAVVRVGVPQGFELVFRDFLGVNYNLTAGAFIYPKILGRSYYNAWLRWGTPALFGEINFIDWREPHADAPSQSRSIGLTFGTTVLRFL